MAGGPLFTCVAARKKRYGTFELHLATDRAQAKET